jgi:hypothetical protein
MCRRLIFALEEAVLADCDNVIYLWPPRTGEQQGHSPLDHLRGLTELIVSLEELLSQIEKWPMDEVAKARMHVTAKSLAMQACALQLSAVGDAHHPGRDQAALNRLIQSLRAPEA